MNVLQNPVITLDCDWAPDFIIKFVSDLLTEYRVKATWFITNNSPSISKLKSNKLFELGIHPNFDLDSTQGRTVDEVFSNLKKIVPNAKSLRTHRLFQSTPILLKCQKYGIENDVSILLFKTSNIEPHYIKYFNLFRIPFFWEDDIQMYDKPKWNQKDILKMKGLKIFNFHPIHIYLNSSNIEKYNVLKNKHSLNSLDENVINRYVNQNKMGVRTMFENILNHLKNKETFTISDLRKTYFE